MWSEKAKTLLFVAWAVAICLAGIAIGITSVPQWVALACVAIAPPAVARSFWHAPEQTLSETIRDARK